MSYEAVCRTAPATPGLLSRVKLGPVSHLSNSHLSATLCKTIRKKNDVPTSGSVKVRDTIPKDMGGREQKKNK